MSKIMKIKNVSDYSRYLGHTDRHPLVSVINYAEVSPIRHSLNSYSVYGIFFHDQQDIDLTYGCGKYDYKSGTVISHGFTDEKVIQNFPLRGKPVYLHVRRRRWYGKATGKTFSC